MRVAVLSDIHGFNLALEVVLADIDRQGPFDAVVVAGDLCELGPAPKECLDLLKQQDFVLIQGNTDLAIVEGAETNTLDPELRYAIDRLTDPDLALLSRLPFSHRITPAGAQSEDEDLLIVHASPHSQTEGLNPFATNDELMLQLSGTRASAIAFGHVHICYIRQLEHYLLVDVAAVGNSKDGDLRCKYGILEWNPATHRWSATIRKLPYPLAATEQQIRQSGVPDAERVIRRLNRASYNSSPRTEVSFATLS